MENVSNDNFWFLVENVTFRPIYDNRMETTEKNIDTGGLKYYTEDDDNVIECIIINDKFEKKVYYKKPMKHSEKDVGDRGETVVKSEQEIFSDGTRHCK